MRLNMSQHATRLGLTPKTMREWRKQGAPFIKQGLAYIADADELDAWAKGKGKYMRHGRVGGEIQIEMPSVGKISKEVQQEVDQDYKGSSAALKEQLAKAELRKRLADAERKEIDVRIRRGELMERADVERGRLERISVVRAGLISLPAKLAPRLANHDEDYVRSELEREVEDVIDVFRAGFEPL